MEQAGHVCQSMRVMIVGCGYVGLALGAALAKAGHVVHGLRRQAGGAEDMAEAGIRPVTGDVTQPETLERLPGPFDWVANTVSSGKGGLEVYEQVYREGTRNLIQWLRDMPLQKYLHTSSTSVYAQADGSVVDETSPAQGASPTSRVLVETEQLLLNAVRDHGFPAVIFRVAGIYGPGRGYLYQQYLKDEARLHGDGSRLINMIHLDDLVGSMVMALEMAQPGDLYNVADDQAVSQQDFFAWLSARLGKPMPPTASSDELAGRKRGVTHKRVSNARLRQGLGYRLKYPTFREGYEAVMRG